MKSFLQQELLESRVVMGNAEGGALARSNKPLANPITFMGGTELRGDGLASGHKKDRM